MIKKMFLLIFGYIVLSSCNQENEVPQENEVFISATGILNGKQWKATKIFGSNMDGLFSFGLMQDTAGIDCPHHSLTFNKIPFKIGSYKLSSDYFNDPIDSIVYSRLFYNCGNEVEAMYHIEEGLESFITISSTSENIVQGHFTTNYNLVDSFPDFIPNFEFFDIDFLIVH